MPPSVTKVDRYMDLFDLPTLRVQALTAPAPKSATAKKVAAASGTALFESLPSWFDAQLPLLARRCAPFYPQSVQKLGSAAARSDVDPRHLCAALGRVGASRPRYQKREKGRAGTHSSSSSSSTSDSTDSDYGGKKRRKYELAEVRGPRQSPTPMNIRFWRPRCGHINRFF